MSLIVAEQNHEQFGALTLTRATFELRYGALSPLERALQITPDVALRCRPYLAAYLRARTGLPVNEDRDGETFPGLPGAWPWEILSHSDKLIAADYAAWQTKPNFRDEALMTGAHLLGSPADVHIGCGSSVLPGCLLDATNGPIIIDENVRVSWSQVTGPVYIGPECVLESARVRPGVSLGRGCKVGGEISATIFQSRVNKAHDGFVGHTWAGRWVNFGAVATTSNIKNTYGFVKWQQDLATTVDTDAQFLGSIIGDHSKIGIMQGLTTSGHIGVGCNVFGGGVAPKYVPSFCWGGLGGWSEHRFDDCLKTTRAVLGRRHATLRPESADVLRHAFESTQPERSRFLRHD